MPEPNLNLTICSTCWWNKPEAGCLKGKTVKHGWCTYHMDFNEGRDIKAMNEEILKYRTCKNGGCE